VTAPINEPWLVEEDVCKTIDQVPPFLLRFLRWVFVGDVAPPLRKSKVADLPDQLVVVAHDGEPRLRLLLIADD
jgi:hypothetical protein